MPELSVKIERAQATITLERPQARNAFNAALINALTQAFRAIGPSVRVVLLQGAGKAFCAGADLNDMHDSKAFTAAQNKASAQALAELFYAIDRAPQVVMARVQGAALGGGLGLCTCCDIVVAEEEAVFGFTEVRLGLVPAVIAPFAVAKIGMSQARRLFLTGETFSAAEARHMGLVHQVVPADALDASVAALVKRCCKNGPKAMRAAKALLAQLPTWAEEEVRDHTTGLIANLRVGTEAQEGMAAFLQKRSPTWAL